MRWDEGALGKLGKFDASRCDTRGRGPASLLEMSLPSCLNIKMDIERATSAPPIRGPLGLPFENRKHAYRHSLDSAPFEVTIEMEGIRHRGGQEHIEGGITLAPVDSNATPTLDLKDGKDLGDGIV